VSQSQVSEYQALAISKFGALDGLQAIDLTIEQPKAQQVLIKMHYAGLNPIDCKTRAGLGWAAEQNKHKLPWVGGYDLAGEVIAVGEEHSSFVVGQKVAGMVGFPLQGGCYAQYVLADVKDLVALESDIDIQQAAALPLAGLTAMQGLFTHGHLENKQRVIISAAAGGVGHIAVQLAKQAGAEVIALASDNNHDFLVTLGADIVLDYHDEKAVSELKRADLLLDLVGGQSGLNLLAALKGGGQVVTVPTLSKDEISAAAKAKKLQATGMLVSSDNAQLQRLFDLLSQNKLKINIANVYNLLDGQQAQKESQLGHVRGKILLKSELI